MNRRSERRNQRATGFSNNNRFGRRDRSTTTRTPRLPSNWRDCLPDPATYFAAHVAKLGKPNANGWASGLCPFHDDRNHSLSVNLSGDRGGWRCFASCGGGDLIGFHMKLRGVGFAAAVHDLIRGRA